MKRDSEMNIYQCPKCSAEFSLGTKFCQNCGCHLAAEFIEIPTCPKCKKAFPTGTKFCDEDGAKLILPENLSNTTDERLSKQYKTEYKLRFYNDVYKIFDIIIDNRLTTKMMGHKDSKEIFIQSGMHNIRLRNQWYIHEKEFNIDIQKDMLISFKGDPSQNLFAITFWKRRLKLEYSELSDTKCINGKEYSNGTNFCPEDGGQVLAEASGEKSNGSFKEKGIDLLASWITKSDNFYENEDKKAFKTSTFFSIGILISFFLPWIDYVVTRFSAFRIPMALDSLANFGQSSGINMAYAKVSYLLYLIPCFAIYNIVSDLTRKENRWEINEFGTGITATVILLILFLANGGNLSIFGIGFYLTAIFSILGLVVSDRE